MWFWDALGNIIGFLVIGVGLLWIIGLIIKNFIEISNALIMAIKVYMQNILYFLGYVVGKLKKIFEK